VLSIFLFEQSHNCTSRYQQRTIPIVECTIHFAAHFSEALRTLLKSLYSDNFGLNRLETDNSDIGLCFFLFLRDVRASESSTTGT